MVTMGTRKLSANWPAHCVKTMNCYGNSLAQKRSFPRIGCAARRPPGDYYYFLKGPLAQSRGLIIIIIIIIIINVDV